MTIKRTQEQENIIKHLKQNPNDSIKIIAGAGCGKTTTLKQIAKEFPNTKYQYLAFNRAIIQDAHTSFDTYPNVEVKTFHAKVRSLNVENFKIYIELNNSAKNMQGNHYPRYSRVAKPWDTLRRLGVRNLDIENEEGEQVTFHARRFIRLIKDTLANFYQSADETITTHHFPHKTAGIQMRNETNTGRQHKYKKLLVVTQDTYNEIVNTTVDTAKKLWDEIENYTYTQETYPWETAMDVPLKQLQLAKAGFGTDFDCLLIDEAQDMSPVLFDIIKNTECQKIFVGDPNQQIFQFTGAINALERIESPEFPLTTSFRFSQEIADIANQILYYCPTQMCLTGGSLEPSRFQQTLFNVETVESDAIILFRQNGTLLTAYLDLLRAGRKACVKPEAKKNLIHMLTAFQGLEKRVPTPSPLLGGVDSLEALAELCASYRKQDHQLEYPDNMQDIYLHYCLFYGDPGVDLEDTLMLLKTSGGVDKQEGRGVGLSTVHTCKGQEFDTVYLADDLWFYPNGSIENYVTYVAITRAKRKLCWVPRAKVQANS